MLQNIWDNFKFIRWLKGGEWIKTQKRGWVTFDCYNEYLSYGFDPIGQEYKEIKKVWQRIKE